MALTGEEIERLAERLAQKAVEGLDVEELLLHSVPYMEGSPGIVWNEDTARDTPCYCTDNICFSRGIIGTLSEPQRGWACNPRRELDSPALRERIERFKGAAANCQAEIAKAPKGERLRPWLECMGRELRGPQATPEGELLAQTSALPPEVEEELEALAGLTPTCLVIARMPSPSSARLRIRCTVSALSCFPLRCFALTSNTSKL